MGASACKVPAIMAADGHLRAVGRPGRERRVKTKGVTTGFVTDT